MKLDAPINRLGGDLLAHLFGNDGAASLRSGDWRFISVIAPVFGFFADVSTVFGHPAPYLLAACAIVATVLALPIIFRTRYCDRCAIPCVFAFILTISFGFVAGTQKVFAAEDTGIAAKAIPSIANLQELIAKSLGVQMKMLATVEDIHVEIARLNEQLALTNERVYTIASVTEPDYKTYRSEELGLTLAFPNNILSLDTTERKNNRLILRDGNGHQRISVSRTSLLEPNDIKLAQQQEKEELQRSGYTLTYVAPEHDQNWKNWYVLSGVQNNIAFYFKRWHTPSSVISIEFIYPKELGSLYDKLIPTMVQSLAFAEAPSKTAP